MEAGKGVEEVDPIPLELKYLNIMKYWLVTVPIHASDIQFLATKPDWPHYKIQIDERLKPGDLMYVCIGGERVFGWGYLRSKETYYEQDLKMDAYKISVVFSIVNPNLIPNEKIRESEELVQLFRFSGGNLVLLTLNQVNELNRLIQVQSGSTPPSPTEIEDESLYALRHAGRSQTDPQFTLNAVVDHEEDRYIGFKEIKGAKPENIIANTADEYAVTFLNGRGGRIFWGINNDRIVTGLELDYSERDVIRRNVSRKLSQITPSISQEDYEICFHKVLDDDQNEVNEIYVCELDVSMGSPHLLYATGSGDVWVKTHGGKQKLNHIQKMDEILRRRGVT